MKAIVIDRIGGPEVFEMREVETPKLKPGHLLVKVKATSVNPIDTKLRKLALRFSPAFPAILHGDFSGVVSEVASDVKGFKVGDKVYGCGGGVQGTEGGALAEYLLVDAALTSPMPLNLSFEQAAAIPLVAITSWEALVDKLQIHAGATLLVHAGVGGVGHFAAQLGRYFGAVVHTTVSNETDAKTSGEHGSHFPINYKTTSVQEYVDKHTLGRGFDFVFDTVGGPNLALSAEAARLNGSIACIATGGSHDLTTMYFKGISLHSVIMLIPMITGENRPHFGEILFQVKKMVEQGAIKPLLHAEIFDWKDIAKAHALQESGKQRGKIVVRINQD